VYAIIPTGISAVFVSLELSIEVTPISLIVAGKVNVIK
jgi:hypothetical protein